jgi:hypothetical protein
MKFFAWLNEQQQGPFDEEAVQKMVSEGQITHETLLCSEGGDLDWTPAKELFPPDLIAKSGVAMTEMLNAEEGFVATQFEQEDDGSRVEVRLTSGLELRIKAVQLYDEITLSEINFKRAEAIKKLQGVSTGHGSIGSIDWVLASSVVIGAVEGALSASAAASGTNLLADVIRMEQKLRTNGVFLHVGRIENLETPIPGLWRVPYKRKAQVEIGMNFWGTKQFDSREIPSALIHSGDEFIWVQTDDDAVCSIRWSTVERYARR